MPFFRVILLMCLVVTVAAATGGCSAEQEKASAETVKPVKMIVVGEREAGALRAFPGVVVAGNAVDLGFRVAGQIAELPVREGQMVRQGDLLGRLDKRDLQTALSNLESQLVGARATLNEARLNFERNEQLLKSDTISRAAYDSAKATYENALARLESMEQQVRQARLNMQYAELRAPFSGVVATKYMKSFENVQPQQSVVRLEDVNSLDVEVEIPEFVYVLYRNYKGVPVPPMVRFEAFPGREFPARLKEYQTTPNSLTQTYTVTMTIDRPADIALQPGMTAEVQGKLPPTGETEGFVLPVTAVFGDAGQGKSVWVVEDDMVVRARSVAVGEMRGEDIIVTAGIAAGEKVVTAGVHYLREGQKVRPLEGPVGGLPQ